MSKDNPGWEEDLRRKACEILCNPFQRIDQAHKTSLVVFLILCLAGLVLFGVAAGQLFNSAQLKLESLVIAGMGATTLASAIYMRPTKESSLELMENEKARAFATLYAIEMSNVEFTETQPMVSAEVLLRVSREVMSGVSAEVLPGVSAEESRDRLMNLLKLVFTNGTI